MKFKSLLSAVAATALAAVSLAVGGPANAVNNCGNLQVSPIHSPTFYIDPASSFDANYIGYKVKNNGGTAASGKSLVLNSFTGGTVTLHANESNTRSLPSIAAGATAYVYFFAQSSATGDVDPSLTTISLSVKTGSTVNCTVSDSLTSVDDVLDTEASSIDVITVTPNTATVEVGTEITVVVEGDVGNIGNGTATDPESIIFAPVTRSASFDPSHYRLISAELVNVDCVLTNDLRYLNLGNTCDNSYELTYKFITIGSSDQTIASQIDGQNYIASGSQIKHPGGTPVSLPLVKKVKKLSYLPNGGTGTMAQESGIADVTLDANGFTYKCHIFKEWNTEADGTGDSYNPTDTYTLSSNASVYAIWEDDPTCTPEEIAAAEAAALANTGSSAPLGLAFFALAMVAAGAVLRRKRA